MIPSWLPFAPATPTGWRLQLRAALDGALVAMLLAAIWFANL